VCFMVNLQYATRRGSENACARPAFADSSRIAEMRFSTVNAIENG
jgi:hypothetical protein